MLPAALKKAPRLLLQPSDLSKAARPATGSRQSISYPWPTPTGSPHTCKSVPVHKRTDTLVHLAHNSPFSAFFTEVVCTLGTTAVQEAASPPPNGGNDVIRTTTRRRHADSQPLMLQNPHRARLTTVARGHTSRRRSCGERERSTPGPIRIGCPDADRL